jgi:phasin family protein
MGHVAPHKPSELRDPGLRDFTHLAFRTSMELMMNSIPLEQIVAAQKAGVDTTFGLLNKSFDAVEKLVGLNAHAVKSSLADNQEILVKALSAGAPQAFFAQQASQAQPAVEKAQSYWRHVYEIISSTQAEFAAFAEAQTRQFQHDAQTLVNRVAKNAPAGSENAMAVWNRFVTTASETANTTYAAARKAAKQAVDTAEINISAAASTSARRSRQLAAPVESSVK